MTKTSSCSRSYAAVTAQHWASSEMVQLFMNAVLFHRVCGSADVSFYGLDGDYCFVATETQQNIQRLWFELVGGSEMATAPAGAGTRRQTCASRTRVYRRTPTGIGCPGHATFPAVAQPRVPEAHAKDHSVGLADASNAAELVSETSGGLSATINDCRSLNSSSAWRGLLATRRF